MNTFLAITYMVFISTLLLLGIMSIAAALHLQFHAYKKLYQLITNKQHRQTLIYSFHNLLIALERYLSPHIPNKYVMLRFHYKDFINSLLRLFLVQPFWAPLWFHLFSYSFYLLVVVCSVYLYGCG